MSGVQIIRQFITHHSLWRGLRVLPALLRDVDARVEAGPLGELLGGQGRDGRGHGPSRVEHPGRGGLDRLKHVHVDRERLPHRRRRRAQRPHQRRRRCLSGRGGGGGIGARLVEAGGPVLLAA